MFMAVLCPPIQKWFQLISHYYRQVIHNSPQLVRLKHRFLEVKQLMLSPSTTEYKPTSDLTSTSTEVWRSTESPSTKDFNTTVSDNTTDVEQYKTTHTSPPEADPSKEVNVLLWILIVTGIIGFILFVVMLSLIFYVSKYSN